MFYLFIFKNSHQSHRLCPDCGIQNTLKTEKGAPFFHAALCSFLGQHAQLPMLVGTSGQEPLLHVHTSCHPSHRGTAELAFTKTPWLCRIIICIWIY